MGDLDDALRGTRPAQESAVSLVTRPHVHTFDRCACGAVHDPTGNRRGRSADRLGKDQERRIQRVYGPRKVGQFGDAIDLLGRDFKWQSKATRAAPSAWLAAVDLPTAADPPKLVTDAEWAMRPLRPDLLPLVIQSFISPGRRPTDRIWVRRNDWRALYGGTYPDELWLVMSGEHFLAVHGPDTEDAA